MAAPAEGIAKLCPWIEQVREQLSPVVADAIREGRPIREILGLLGKEPRGELSE